MSLILPQAQNGTDAIVCEEFEGRASVGNWPLRSQVSPEVISKGGWSDLQMMI